VEPIDLQINESLKKYGSIGGCPGAESAEECPFKEYTGEYQTHTLALKPVRAVRDASEE